MKTPGFKKLILSNFKLNYLVLQMIVFHLNNFEMDKLIQDFLLIFELNQIFNKRFLSKDFFKF